LICMAQAKTPVIDTPEHYAAGSLLWARTPMKMIRNTL